MTRVPAAVTRMVVAIACALATVAFGPASPTDPCWVRGDRARLPLRASPYDSVRATLGEAEVKVCYSRPSARGRPVMGGLVPFGEAWRMGANEATTLHVPVALRFGPMVLEPGVYSLLAIPGPDSWEVVVNAAAERWGIPIRPAVRAQDVGSVTVTAERTEAPVEQFTIRLLAAEGELILVAEWERTRVRVPLRPV